MKPVLMAACVAALLSLSTAVPAGAQGGGGNPASGQAAGRRGRFYDPATVETIRGDVLRVDVVSGGGKSGGVHVLLKTASEDVSVRLGPAWYLEKQGLKLAPNDQIEVKGSRLTIDSKPAIVAAVITKGAKVVQLRDDAGVPAWRGGGRAR